jgi:hypothetical protein
MDATIQSNVKAGDYPRPPILKSDMNWMQIVANADIEDAIEEMNLAGCQGEFVSAYMRYLSAVSAWNQCWPLSAVES